MKSFSEFTMPTISLKQVMEKLRSHELIICSLIALVLIGLALLRIHSLLNPALDYDAYRAELQKAQPITFDEEAIEAVRELEDSAEPIEANLPDGRTNPF